MTQSTPVDVKSPPNPPASYRWGLIRVSLMVAAGCFLAAAVGSSDTWGWIGAFFFALSGLIEAF